jgi:hypothetical protein
MSAPFHPWAVQLPNHESTIATREGKIQLALDELTAGVKAHDMQLVLRGLKAADTIRKHSPINMSPSEIASFVSPAMEIALDLTGSWVTLSGSSHALITVANLLRPRNPALVPLVCGQVKWDKLLALAQLHSFSDHATSKLGSDEMLKAHCDAVSHLLRHARFYQPEKAADEVWDFFKAQVGDSNSDRLQESQMLMYMLYPAQKVEDRRLEDWMECWASVDHSSEWYVGCLVLAELLENSVFNINHMRSVRLSQTVLKV